MYVLYIYIHTYIQVSPNGGTQNLSKLAHFSTETLGSGDPTDPTDPTGFRAFPQWP